MDSCMNTRTVSLRKPRATVINRAVKMAVRLSCVFSQAKEKVMSLFKKSYLEHMSTILIILSHTERFQLLESLWISIKPPPRSI